MDTWIERNANEVRKPRKKKNLRQRPLWDKEVAHTTVNGVGKVGRLRNRK